METNSECYMPVDGEWSRRRHMHLPGLRVPWAMLVPHDEQAKRNHAGQDLARLRARGGVSACEALAILDDRDWQQMDEDAAHAELARRIAAAGHNPKDSRMTGDSRTTGQPAA